MGHPKPERLLRCRAGHKRSYHLMNEWRGCNAQGNHVDRCRTGDLVRGNSAPRRARPEGRRKASGRQGGLLEAERWSLRGAAQGRAMVKQGPRHGCVRQGRRDRNSTRCLVPQARADGASSWRRHRVSVVGSGYRERRHRYHAGVSQGDGECANRGQIARISC